MVTRLLQGVFNSTSPQPRYASFWDVGVVIRHIKDLGDNKDLSLKQLTMKKAMLLALTRPLRSADLSKLNLHTVQMEWFSTQLICPGPQNPCRTSSQALRKTLLYAP